MKEDCAEYGSWRAVTFLRPRVQKIRALLEFGLAVQGKVNVSAVPLRYVVAEVIEQLKLVTGPMGITSPAASAALR